MMGTSLVQRRRELAFCVLLLLLQMLASMKVFYSSHTWHQCLTLIVDVKWTIRLGFERWNELYLARTMLSYQNKYNSKSEEVGMTLNLKPSDA